MEIDKRDLCNPDVTFFKKTKPVQHFQKLRLQLKGPLNGLPRNGLFEVADQISRRNIVLLQTNKWEWRTVSKGCVYIFRRIHDKYTLDVCFGNRKWNLVQSAVLHRVYTPQYFSQMRFVDSQVSGNTIWLSFRPIVSRKAHKPTPVVARKSGHRQLGPCRFETFTRDEFIEYNGQQFEMHNPLHKRLHVIFKAVDDGIVFEHCGQPMLRKRIFIPLNGNVVEFLSKRDFTIRLSALSGTIFFTWVANALTQSFSEHVDDLWCLISDETSDQQYVVNVSKATLNELWNTESRSQMELARVLRTFYIVPVWEQFHSLLKTALRHLSLQLEWVHESLIQVFKLSGSSWIFKHTIDLDQCWIEHDHADSFEWWSSKCNTKIEPNSISWTHLDFCDICVGLFFESLPDRPRTQARYLLFALRNVRPLKNVYETALRLAL